MIEEGNLAVYYSLKENEGVNFFVDEHQVEMKEALKIVEENPAYMADYIFGEDGTLSEIHWDKIDKM